MNKKTLDTANHIERVLKLERQTLLEAKLVLVKIKEKKTKFLSIGHSSCMWVSDIPVDIAVPFIEKEIARKKKVIEGLEKEFQDL